MRRGEVMLFMTLAMFWAGVVAILTIKEINEPSPPPMDVQAIVDRAIKEAGK
jgi:hypothetical protein